ncbi:hypothetical protein [Amorphus sp. 3PC139-8]|uniref:hypothetical protein n=1 Tax=Amorphus sp. 3PC139-8 TaxID=2735676 RepID=UPI00345D5B97
MGPAPLLALLLVFSLPAYAQEAADDAPPPTNAANLDQWLAVPEPVMVEHMTISKCEEPFGPALEDLVPVTAELSGTATLYAIPCSAGQTRPTYRLYVHETGEIEGVHPTFPAVFTRAYGWQGTARVYDVDWDAGTSRLTAEGPRDEDGRIGVGVWSWGSFGLKLERYSLIDANGNAERVYPPAE